MAKEEGNNTVSSREKDILKFWEDRKIFEKSEGRYDTSFFEKIKRKVLKKKEFIFYDGPPFATGLPHFGHILASAVKDAVPRYKTMKGHLVKRRWGWDCHGLPLEVEMEKEIGSKCKKDVEDFGIENFNGKIRDVIFKYADEWCKIIPRIGRWVDMENDYRTVNTSYTESVWAIFNKLNENGFVSNGFKSLHMCPRCSTNVSNTEVADSYEMLKDIAVHIVFPLKEDPNMNLVAWTTTPWTLFGNVALGIDKEIEYSVIEQDGKKYVVHENSKHLFENGKVVEKRKGADFVGKEYLPPFERMHKGSKNKKIWRVQEVPFIDVEVGTGIVHLAPAYGDEDMQVAEKLGLPIEHHVSKDGVFIDKLGDFAGLRPKEEGNPKTVDKKILENLTKKGVLLKQEEIEHSYPVCWRCKTPLLNYASDSWFIHTEKFKENMISANNEVNWVPGHIKGGRFGKWLENTKPWAVSRSRFWGAPLPIWKIEKTGEYIMVNSLESMLSKMKKRNTYTFVRHGESIGNVKGIINCRKQKNDGLTEKGKSQAREAGEILRNSKPTVIISSPLTRAMETAECIKETTGAEIIEDKDVIEIQIPEFHNKPSAEYAKMTDSMNAYENIRTKIADGESYFDIFERTLKFLEKIDKQYEGANIIVVTHRIVIESAKVIETGRNPICLREIVCAIRKSIKNASVIDVDYKYTKRTEDGEIDLHRPYIDDIVLYDKDGNPAHFIKEVFDCWFESGLMPYASNHYPFKNSKSFDPIKNKGFPADFICEGLDQTRGWFYSLMAIGVGAFNKSPYKTVIVTGIIAAGDGKKMSKSLKNYSDPMDIVEKYGADSLRHYLLGSPVVRGEALSFSDEGVEEISKKVYGRLHNCLNFYSTYANMPHKKGSKNILDVYILSRLSETIEKITKGFEEYRLDEAVSPIGSFVEDLSVWYVRRSRNRIRYDTEDGAHARETLMFVLIEFSKCIAPIAPFYAEYLFREMKKYHSHLNPLKESVHLCEWPKAKSIDRKAIETMETTRKIVSISHEQRSNAEIRVRQPLQKVVIKEEVSDEIKEIIAEEINVKEVVVDKKAKEDVMLHTEITEELRIEGFVRECIRNLQSARKKLGLSITETLEELHLSLPKEHLSHVEKFEEKIKKELRMKKLVLTSKEVEGGEEILIDKVKASILLVENSDKLFK